ncbi:nucleoside/nucleotide kinase family protein [Gordonia sp. NPDC003585]|uniref:nucleoside/nucleotide kinase family protein n=1 Tax=Gordonia sp. NPDC003585 TaxID=3154275 RepID=UPI00339F9B3F
MTGEWAIATTIAELATHESGRIIVGFTGPPGAGKTTMAGRVATLLARRLGPDAVGYLPMDGFHLSNAVLERLGRRDRKGAPDTFDVHGFVATLRRITDADTVVYVPGFDHAAGEPIAAQLVIPSDAQVVVTEGNYLGLDAGWAAVRPLLALLYYVDAPDEVRTARLLKRHVAAGKTPEQSRAWIDDADRPNATMIAATRDRADAVIDNAAGHSARENADARAT